MRSLSRLANRPQPVMNVTPLVDVVLVLLIIFMVMAPQMRKGPDVNLPNTTKPNAQGDERGRILVSIDESGGLWINDQPVTAEHFAEAARQDKVALHVDDDECGSFGVEFERERFGLNRAHGGAPFVFSGPCGESPRNTGVQRTRTNGNRARFGL